MSVIDLDDFRAHLNMPADYIDGPTVMKKVAAAEEFIDQFLATKIADYDVVPEPIREAVRQLAAHLFENREATVVNLTVATVPFTVLELIGPYRGWSF